MVKVPFIINEKAFREEGLDEVLKSKVVAKEPLPETKTSLRRVLEMVFRRVPTQSGAAFLVRKDHLEITTEAAVLREFGVPRTPEEDANGVRLLPLIVQNVKRVTLESALIDIADGTGFNVVLDLRAEEQAKAMVSARFVNVPIDTAVRVLADMGGLSVVRLDNVFYVTTPENAKKLAAEKPAARPGERRSLQNLEQPGGM